MPARRRVIVFDDAGGALSPLTDLRASFELRTGCLTTLERIGATLPGVEVAGVFVAPGLAPVVRERSGVPVNDPGVIGSEPALLVGGRCVLPPAAIVDLAPGAALVSEEGEVLGARLDAGAARAVLEHGTLPAGCARTVLANARVLRRPWDVIRHRDASIAADLALLLERAGLDGAVPETALEPGAIRIAPDARVHRGVVLDAESGPIVLDAGATVRPNAVITGPAYVGPGSTVLECSVIRPGTVLGPLCKVGGEVSGTIFQGYANKAHDGFVGDTYVGEWANLGAGTITSNLLNTYGEVRAAVPHGAARERTGLTFFGSIVGDHVKTAIGTRLMTGTVLGTGAMIATSGPPPSVVENFAWMTEGRSLLYRLSKFLEVCETVMSRRGVSLGEAQRERMRVLHEAVTSGLVAPPVDYQI